MAADPKPRALELVESGGYGTQTPDAPATPHAMNTSPCATLAVRATLAVIVLANVVLVASLLAIGGRYPALVSPGLLALGFGLRHGVDCDHIAAIDNVARKLAYSGKPAALVGLWFSLGHSTMVVLLCGIVATGSSLIRSRVDAVASTGAVVSAVFSSVTLTLIGAFNLATVGPQFRAWRRAANKEQREHHHNHNAELIDEGEQVRVEVTGGLFARCGCCKRLLASVDAAWKMYFVGVLFGLGFETASEVGLLALAAVGPKDVPAPLVMLLPALFTSGMALVDTCDGLLVLFTFAKGNDGDAAGALLFGALLTAASAAASLAIGSIVGLGLVAPFLPPRVAGPLVALSDALDAHTTAVGLAVVGMFVAALVLSMAAPTLHRAARQLCPQCCCGKTRRRPYAEIST
jgi:high-affinity nickel-transport protein